MKSFLLLSLILLGAVGLIRAQGKFIVGGNDPGNRPAYDPKTKPRVQLDEAYSLAAARLGRLSNGCYCINSTCVDGGISGHPVWEFSWANTNGERACVEVTFDKQQYVDGKTELLLRGK